MQWSHFDTSNFFILMASRQGSRQMAVDTMECSDVPITAVVWLCAVCGHVCVCMCVRAYSLVCKPSACVWPECNCACGCCFFCRWCCQAVFINHVTESTLVAPVKSQRCFLVQITNADVHCSLGVPHCRSCFVPFLLQNTVQMPQLLITSMQVCSF